MSTKPVCVVERNENGEFKVNLAVMDSGATALLVACLLKIALSEGCSLRDVLELIKGVKVNP